MYFSADALYNYLTELDRNRPEWRGSYVHMFTSMWDMEGTSRSAVRKAHAMAIANVKARNSHNVGKWYRPWKVVSSLKNWHAPEGDWGVGIEVELGFPSLSVAQRVAEQASSMRHITLDFEGGTYPIEATFPPTRYSTFGSKSQACRYLKLVDGVATRHNENSCVGTHVNVSKGGTPCELSFSQDNRLRAINNALGLLDSEDKRKYFGRTGVYGYGYNRGTFIEWKLFNSVTDWRVLRRYVDTAVALTKVIYDRNPITREYLLSVLEEAYNKRNKKKETA